MASFLRKKVTRSKNIPSPPPRSPDRPPPSLPPLLLSPSLDDARSPLPLPAAASPPVLPDPDPLLLGDVWDPWMAFVSTTSVPHPNPVATAPTSRKTSTDLLGNHPLPQKPAPPAVARAQQSPPPPFDFEESLSAANVTSVVNQFRSYPPPIRHHTSPAPSDQVSKMAIQRPSSSAPLRHHTSSQKPGSSSSLSSSSHNTDATRRTNGSYSTSTSASSISPAIDVKQPNGRLDYPVGSLHDNSLSPLANASSKPRSRGSSVDYNPPPVASPPSHTFTISNASSRVHRPPTAPPTSYSERVRTLARQTSLTSLASSSGYADPHTRPPMLYDMLRSGKTDSVGPLRRGPLIFAAQQPAAKGPVHMNPQNAYPSPPVQYASLEASPPPRRSSATSAQFDLRSRDTVTVSPTFYSSDLPPLTRKMSKNNMGTEHPTVGLRVEPGSEHARRVLTKTRPTTPQKPVVPPSQKVLPEPGDPLLLDDDPFAKTEGVKMLRPQVRPSSRSGSTSSASLRLSKEVGFHSEDGHVKTPSTPPLPAPGAPVTPDAHASATPEKSLPTPTTPDDYKAARQQRRGQWLEKALPPAVAEVAKQLSMGQETEQVEEPPREPTPPPTYFPIVTFMSDAILFPLLLSYLSYSEWLALYSANKQVRDLFQSRILREFVLERYLGTVGYSKWNYEWAEPIELSLKDLHNYLRGVAMPAHQYGRLAAAYLQPKGANREAPTTSETPDILALALTTRAYTRVVLRLRAQADSEAKYIKTLRSAESNISRPGTRQPSVSSRAPSPTSSHSHSGNHLHGKNARNSSFSSAVSKFKSPLYRPGRAPVLRVFVPSPEGDWLSDAGIVECEAELKRSGVVKLLRVGDIVWDAAVGDEGNLGRLMWDGSYLVDLDYRYSRVGELSPYFHSLAVSPSYFHRVIRIGGSATHNPHCNPIIYIDVSPWGREIAANLQLLQDRARTETPHGALHDVVRWVHRTTFTIRPPAPPSQSQTQSRSRDVRIPIPKVEGFYIDPGWYGKVVLESEGTHEGLVDLQARCGPGVFPPRAESLATKIRNEKEKDNRRVWRILREKSRPGEIWLRAVQVEERIM